MVSAGWLGREMLRLLGADASSPCSSSRRFPSHLSHDCWEGEKSGFSMISGLLQAHLARTRSGSVLMRVEKFFKQDLNRLSISNLSVLRIHVESSQFGPEGSPHMSRSRSLKMPR